VQVFAACAGIALTLVHACFASLFLIFALALAVVAGTLAVVLDRRGMSMKLLQTLAAPKNVSCFILTLNESLEAVHLKEDIVCHPFVGKNTDADIFSLVDTQIQNEMMGGVWSRGAHYTNNKSVSIAWNHMLLWQKLVRTDGSQDLLIFEDDAIITNHSIDVYRETQKSGILRQNYIIKLVNKV